MKDRFLTWLNTWLDAMRSRQEVTDHLNEVCKQMIRLAREERDRDFRD